LQPEKDYAYKYKIKEELTMKKKVLFFVLSAIMLAFLVGCGGSGNGSSSTVASSDQDVGSTNLAPVADAGDDKTVRPDDLVNLDGTASSDSDENYPLSFAWQMMTQPAGSSATLSDADTSTPSFTVDMEGDYTIQALLIQNLWLMLGMTNFSMLLPAQFSLMEVRASIPMMIPSPMSGLLPQNLMAALLPFQIQLHLIQHLMRIYLVLT
jgi:hypothetical protein